MSFELVCYLNFGYPTITDSIRDAELYIENGCRALQLDIPSRDPYLEHEFVKNRMKHCLETEPDYEKYFEGIREIHRNHPDVALYFMLYENIVNELGAKRITDFCKEVNIRYASYVGSNQEVKARLEAAGLGICCYVQYDMPEEEVAFARLSTGPVLYQAKSVGKLHEGCKTFSDGVRYLRGSGLSMPIYASVGIKNVDDIKMVKDGGADGAFIGSVLMHSLDDNVKFSQTMSSFSEAVKG